MWMTLALEQVPTNTMATPLQPTGPAVGAHNKR
jgi:hypothetical protein